MTFNKERYWKRRKQGKRGQEYQATTKHFPKGEKVYRVNSKGERVEVPNAIGNHRGFGGSGGMYAQNRKEYRQRMINRDYTTPKYEYVTTKRTDSEGNPDYFKGHVKNEKKNPPPPRRMDSYLSNHDRHRARQLQRDTVGKNA